jgi:Tat protein secretion system quality control protein TatD with DNase activity
MKGHRLLFITSFHQNRLLHTTTTIYQPSIPKSPFRILDRRTETNDSENNNENDYQNDSVNKQVPPSLDDIPHWTTRPIAKQQKHKVAQVDYDTYWKKVFKTKSKEEYKNILNIGFVDRGEFTVRVPKQYPIEPAFEVRQWSNTAQQRRSTATTLQLQMSSSNHHERHVAIDSRQEDQKLDSELPLSGENECNPRDNHSSHTVLENVCSNATNVSSSFTPEELPLQPQPKMRIVDVDCNLWHKDLLLLLLPKLPISSPSTSSNVETVSDAVDYTQSLPDCLQILHNDDLSPVVAMITPSSTIAEAAKGLDILRCYGHPCDNRTSKESESTNQHQQQQQQPRIRLRTTVGVHPYHVPDPFHAYHDDTNHTGSNDAVTDIMSTMEHARRLLDDSQYKLLICAIGECGLDTTKGFPPIAYQIPFFIAQIQLANEYQLPLFLHERNAHVTMIELLNEYVDPNRIPNIIIHCFTGTVDDCQAYVEHGYYISISGFIFRENEASHVQYCLEHDIIPLDKLMIETDSPYMGFTGCRELFVEKNRQAVNAPHLTSKERKVYSIKQYYPNPPSSIVMVLHQVLYHINIGRTNRCEKILSLEEFANITVQNANTVFGLGL